MGKHVPEEQIWIDLQPGPNFKEAILCPVKSLGEEPGYINLHKVLPVDDWVKAFSEVKWCGYIFTFPEYRDVLHNASKEVINDAFNIRFNKFSKILCKIEEESSDKE